MFRRFGGPFYPLREVERLRREMNRLAAELPSGGRVNMAAGYPAINVWTNEDGAILSAELPGVKPDDIDISVVNDTLTLKGQRNRDECGQESRFHRRERGCGSFTRSFQLPFQVEPGKVEATFDKGVLEITLPRAEADKPRKITIKAG
ncbi:MAG: Hsp20/alpha crystallin family protein [Anaerolineae bacterium]|nr:Hsp20/alpha crystallin family protein [Anaerolineae bacterium]